MKYIIPGETEYEMASVFCESSSFKLLKVNVSKFADGELHLNFPIKPCPEDEVFILMRLSASSVDLMFLLCNIAWNLTRFGVKRIITICPYLCYARSDRESSPGDAISIGTILHLFSAAGISALLSVDIHSPHLKSLAPQGFRILNTIPVDLIANYLKGFIPSFQFWQVLGTDKGSKLRVSLLAEKLAIPWICLEKQRYGDVISISLGKKGKLSSNIIIYDDIITSGGTMIKCVELLRSLGVTRIGIVISHIVLPDAISQLTDMGVEFLVGTNSIFSSHSKLDLSDFLLEMVQSNF